MILFYINTYIYIYIYIHKHINCVSISQTHSHRYMYIYHEYKSFVQWGKKSFHPNKALLIEDNHLLTSSSSSLFFFFKIPCPLFYFPFSANLIWSILSQSSLRHNHTFGFSHSFIALFLLSIFSSLFFLQLFFFITLIDIPFIFTDFVAVETKMIYCEILNSRERDKETEIFKCVIIPPTCL